jgi:hypothetical protein
MQGDRRRIVAYTIEGRLYPDKGDLLIHKTQGYIGKYQQDVFTNNDRRHFLVRAIDSPLKYVLPDTDWELYVVPS